MWGIGCRVQDVGHRLKVMMWGISCRVQDVGHRL